MTIPNEVAEPEKVADDVAQAKEPVTPTPEQDVEQKPLSDQELNNELAVKEEPKPQVSEEQRNQDRQVRDAKFNLQLTTNLNQVNKAVADGGDFEEALNGVPQHLQGKIRKIAAGESIEDKFDAKSEINTEVSRQLALEKSTSILAEAIKANKLNVATAEAQAIRKALNADYQRLLASNSPEEAANYALFNAGIANKQAINDAYDNGVKHGSSAVPTPGIPGQAPVGGIQPGTEPTVEQIVKIPFEELRKLDEAVATNHRNSRPLTQPGGQGNPNVR